MATSLLRLGRLGSLKCLLRGSWGTQRTPFVAAFCTKADAPPKTAKKAKAASKTDERASLLAYKPAVAFPSKLSATGFLPKDIVLGESPAKVVTTETVVAAADTTEQHLTSQSVTEAKDLTKETEAAEAISAANVDETTTYSPVADTAAAKATVEEDEITEVHPADKVSTGSEGSKASDVEAEVQQAQDDTSSSSSSDSESDSDSDSDDEKPKTETVVKSKEKAAEEVLTSKQVHVAESVIAPSASFEESQKYAQARVKPEGVPTTSTEAVGSGETLTDPAPVIFSSTTEAIPEVTGESIDVVSLDEMVDTAAEVKTAPTENIVENESETKAKAAPEEEQQPANVKTSPTEAATEGSTQEVANSTVESSPGVPAEALVDVVSQAVQEVVAEPESGAASETMAKDIDATGTVASSEDLKDPAPVAGDAVAAQSLSETEVVEAPEEQAPEKAPEPEPEPFDNTTYQNLQHHHYNVYTFVDMDVEMAKYRLPQPSSGRPSLRH